MKKLLLFLLTTTLLIGLNAQTSKRVLFIGNSYVYTNDLPTMLRTLAAGCGDTLISGQSTPGGCSFANHLNNATTTSLIAQGGWDCVILQEQSQIPSFPISQVETGCFPYAQELCENIRAVMPNTEIVFFMTWGRKNGDSGNCAYYPPLCTYEGMDSLLCERYLMMAQNNHATVSPVGRVWRAIRREYPDIELYNSDESHPSVAGTYAAAVTFYSILFKTSPTCISNDLSLVPSVAQSIRETVETVVYDSLAYWYQWSNLTDGVEDEAVKYAVKVYPNPAAEVVQVICGNENVSGSVEVSDLFGRLISVHSLLDGKASINLSNYKSGVYIFRTTLNGQIVHIQKVVKQ